MITIAVLLTCYNRKTKTVRCLTELFRVLESYNERHKGNVIAITIFLVDDASTDGTSEAIISLCKNRSLFVIKGDGKRYWAGGMRLAWREAMKYHERWNYYLLLNDDTVVKENVFEELLECREFALAKFGKEGIYSGCTSDEEDPMRITYSGDVMNRQTKGWNRLSPNGTPQMVDMTNANILLVAKDVVDQIGIFPDGYIHSAADQDYGMMARRAGFPVLITSFVCGFCAYDHLDESIVCQRLKKMCLQQRKAYVFHPTHSDLDYLLFIKRNLPKRYVISIIMRKIRLYAPSLYLFICKKRGIL